MSEAFWIQKSFSLKSPLVCKPRWPSKLLEGWPHQLPLQAYTITFTEPNHLNSSLHPSLSLSLDPQFQKQEPRSTSGGSELIRIRPKAKPSSSKLFLFQRVVVLMPCGSCLILSFFLCFHRLFFVFHRLISIFTDYFRSHIHQTVFIVFQCTTSVFFTVFTGSCCFLHFNQSILCFLCSFTV